MVLSARDVLLLAYIVQVLRFSVSQKPTTLLNNPDKADINPDQNKQNKR